MFIHSVRVPRLYKTAAKILQEVKENGGSLKQLLYTNKHSNIKAIYALIVKTLKHFSQIDILLEKSQLLVKENRFNPWLARILITELLWNEKPLSGESKPIKTILSYYDVLKKLKLTLDSKAEPKITKKVEKPRFVRINTLLTTLEEVVNGFREEGWKLTPSASQTYDEYLSKTNVLGPDQFMIDLHLKEVLLFPSNTEFYKHYAYKKGLIILQDKASCLPARLLNPPPGSTVLDMCAAPGMKTTHVAAVLNNEGTVYAVERNAKRFETLKKMVENAGATCVKTLNKDVLQITADDCPNVEYILVDPSCSGSGIVNRIEINDQDTTADPARLKRLTNFQAKILKHALTAFPQAKRVVYSTCSVYSEENENVVKEGMGIGNFKLISAKNLLEGPWKGSVSEHQDAVRDMCLYTKPEEDLTNGFFIAVFEREESQYHRAEELQNDLTVANNEKKKKKNKSASTDLDLVRDSVPDFQENSRKRKSKVKTEATEQESNPVEEQHEWWFDGLTPKKIKKECVKESKEILFSEENTEELKDKNKKKKSQSVSEIESVCIKEEDEGEGIKKKTEEHKKEKNEEK